MKKITTILALVGTLTLGLAADATIDAQIEKIQNAPAQERVELMNQFKKQLMTMNQEQREEAISKMQTKMHNGKSSSHAKGEYAENAKANREMARTRAREMQQNNMPDVNQMQNVNQHQAGGQFQQMGAAGAGSSSGSTGMGGMMNH